MTIHRLRKVALGALAALAFSAATSGAAQADVHDPGGKPWKGCPAGAVCLYSPAGYENNNPEHVYWSYGEHKLYNEFGSHYLLNNQTGGARASVWYDYNDEHAFVLPAGASTEFDFTPVNSLSLFRGGW